jgi:hypothetical protein
VSNIDHGMNIGEVNTLIQQLRTRASEIGDIRTALNSIVSGSNAIWRGPDADRFRNDWSGSLSTQLTQVQNALNDFAGLAQQNVSQQQSTSA